MLSQWIMYKNEENNNNYIKGNI